MSVYPVHLLPKTCELVLIERKLLCKLLHTKLGLSKPVRLLVELNEQPKKQKNKRATHGRDDQREAKVNKQDTQL